MHALAERQVLIGIAAMQVEAVEIGEHRGVAIRGREPSEQFGAARQLNAARVTGRVVIRRHTATDGSNRRLSSIAAAINPGIADDRVPPREHLEHATQRVADPYAILAALPGEALLFYAPSIKAHHSPPQPRGTGSGTRAARRPLGDWTPWMGHSTEQWIAGDGELPDDNASRCNLASTRKPTVRIIF